MHEHPSPVPEASTIWHAAARLPPDVTAALWAYLGGLFDAPHLDELRRAALDVHGVIPGSVAYFSEIDFVSGEVATVSEPPAAGGPAARGAYARHRHQDPVARKLEQSGGHARPLAVSDLMDEITFTASEIYTEFYRPTGQLDQMVIAVPVAHQVATVALTIGREQWGFSDAERVAAGIIQRGLLAAYRALWQQDSARTAGRVTSRLLARSGVEVCVVDRFGERIGLDGQVVASDPAIAEAISNAGRLAANGSRTPGDGPVVLELKVADSQGEPATVQVLASDDGVFWPVVTRRTAARVRVEDLVARGLTTRQAEVMALLLEGRTTGAAALELGISPRTAEKHIHMACRALGAHTRTEALVDLAAGSA